MFGSLAIQDAIMRARPGRMTISEEAIIAVHVPLLLSWLKAKPEGRVCTVGITGSQGLGKTTLCRLYVGALENLGLKASAISLDDFYTSLTERRELALRHPENPFYQVSRGMPGTHRVEYLLECLSQSRSGKTVEYPQFDKSAHGGQGEISPKWLELTGKLDFLFLEGWCTSMPVIPVEEFQQSVHRNEYVSAMIKELGVTPGMIGQVMSYLHSYQAVWQMLDQKALFLAADIRWIEAWRIEQERALIASSAEGMDDAAVRNFIRPYIPFTWLYFDPVIRSAFGFHQTVAFGKDHQPIAFKPDS